MSHLKERIEKNCLNCNAQIYGKYCHICGQENIEPKDTFWHLISHFFQDITHFDGKFFSTLKLLITKPGYLSKEYLQGKRMSYLNPIRMYIFTSAFFFFIFFCLVNFGDKEIVNNSLRISGMPLNDILIMDSSSFAKFTAEKINNGVPMHREDFKKYVDSVAAAKAFHIAPGIYKNKAAYDSVLTSGVKKHNWLQRKLVYKDIELNEKFAHNQSKLFSIFVYTLAHSFPQMFFISLPLFALMLKLLYIRRKKYYLVDHAIFSIHFYIFVFIALLSIIGIKNVAAKFSWVWLQYLTGAIVFSIFFYLYKSLRNFYGQSRLKTIVKFILLNIFSIFMILVLLIGFIFFSFFKI